MSDTKAKGYKGHRVGSKAEKAHKLVDDNPKAERKDLVAKIKKLYPKVKFSRFFLSRRKGYTINSYVGRCQAARTTVSLKPNGTISLPCLLHTAANSSNAPLREFWRSDEAKQTREKCGRYGFCEKCDVICMYEASLIGHPIQIARWLSEM